MKGAQTKELTTGDNLRSNDQIIITETGYLGLVHSSGKILDIEQSGSYSVSELERKIKKEKQEESQRYGQFIMARLSDSEKQRVRNTQRSLGSNGDIRVALPQEAELLGNTCVLRWQTSTETPMYTVSVLNIFGDTFLQRETEDGSLAFDLSSLENDMGLFVFNVRGKDDPDMTSGDYTIKKVKADDMPAVVEKLDRLQSEMSGNSPLEVLILASFYEENNLLVDAIREYEMGAKKFPEVSSFYQMFLETYELN